MSTKLLYKFDEVHQFSTVFLRSTPVISKAVIRKLCERKVSSKGPLLKALLVFGPQETGDQLSRILGMISIIPILIFWMDKIILMKMSDQSIEQVILVFSILKEVVIG